MTTKKTKKTPQAVLDIIAKQEAAISEQETVIATEVKHREHYRTRWLERGVAIERALADNENYKKQCFDRAKEVDVLNAKLRETEQQVGKLLADAKRARDASGTEVFVLMWYSFGNAGYADGVFGTEEAARERVRSNHASTELKWHLGSAQVFGQAGHCVGQYEIVRRKFNPQP